MDNEEFKLTESGTNPTDTSRNEKKDIYFSNIPIDVSDTVSSTPSKAVSVKGKRKARRSIAGTYFFFIFVIVVSMLLSVYAVLCVNDVLAITKTNSVVTITLNESLDDMDKAVDILADNGLIKCRNFCKFFAEFRKTQVGPSYRNGVYFEDKSYEPGVYYLYGKMGLEGMLQALQGSNTTAETVTITFPEGYTTAEIVDKLVANEVCDKAALLSVIQTVDFSYSLVSNIESKEEVPYRLEGYLFPDTYDFFVGESASSVVKKFLANGDAKVTEKYRKRAEDLGYTMDEIMIIASIIQAEAGSTEQMKEISGVIHNRLSDKANYPSLGCDATSDYIRNKVAPSLSSTSSHTSDYYLKYYSTDSSSTVVGLPASPICNPGIDAIKAALYPAKNGCYYFFHDNKRNLYTAKTYSEFKQKVSAYAPYLL